MPGQRREDYLVHEWAHKPIGLVSYGGVSGGVRAVHALKPVLSALKMIPVHEGVIIPFVGNFIEGAGDDRRFVPNDIVEAGADAMLAAISKWIPAVRAAAGQDSVAR